jgi:hypothetical protein
VIIAGSRDIKDYDLVRSAVEDFQREYAEITEVVAVSAKKFDAFVQRHCEENLLKYKRLPVEWNGGGGNGDRPYDPAARRKRNWRACQWAAGLITIGDDDNIKDLRRTARKLGLMTVEHGKAEAA